jgi:8-oxo-dGTP diphosphatase
MVQEKEEGRGRGEEEAEAGRPVSCWELRKMAVKMKRYVVGFYYSWDDRKLLLIQKKRPEWQQGKYNGVGGHIEKGEKPIEAMRREFREETGLDLSESRWHNFAIVGGKDWEVHFYEANRDPKEDMPKTMTDEYVEFFDVDHIPEAVIPNLRWLIPMSMPAYRQPQDWPFLIREGFKGERS